jgi:ferredoxin
MPTLTFCQYKRSIQLREGTELVRIPHIDATAPLKFGCGKGQCGTCAIKIVSGEENLSPKTKEEEATLSRLRLDSHRLACQCALKGDVVIETRDIPKHTKTT